MSKLSLEDIYLKNEKISPVFKTALGIEKDYEQGIEFGDVAKLRAWLNPDGLWQGAFELETGKLSFNALDDQGKVVRLSSATFCNETNRFLEDEELVFVVDLSSTKNILEAKKFFLQDPFLRSIEIPNFPDKNLADLLFYYLRFYRKKFKNYVRDYGFLWQNTKFNSARQIASVLT